MVNEVMADEKAEINVRLYEKMQEELDEFRSKFCDADPMVVMENAYELTMNREKPAAKPSFNQSTEVVVGNNISIYKELYEKSSFMVIPPECQIERGHK